MPRFYFHVRNDVIVDDEEGMELPDLEAARNYAVASARSIAAESILSGKLNLSHCIQIAEAQGEVVSIVELRDALTIEN